MVNGKVTAWVGWIWFAGTLMIMDGVFNAITGLVAIFNRNFFIRSGRDVVLIPLTGMGWFHLIIGITLLAVGAALIAGQVWARLVAVILVAVNAVAHMMTLPAYPWWSITMIAIDIFILYALVVHGEEARRAHG
ncbi:hypothetical protein [Microtetraspora sp. NBRC 16547]|uniref:DUF7144 family membrane protein n=1 Tax=Microtetraspora sp. NBRC 16547 TaxID=3030993 RepID=UPI0024A20BEA|nr:hypothetical protein [Microtetraspora sp. NBRC 16547]GLX02150.1 membrane protein [Microtetraspora sp. NBRC 16547]